jgi:hypothetical protein
MAINFPLAASEHFERCFIAAAFSPPGEATLSLHS